MKSILFSLLILASSVVIVAQEIDGAGRESGRVVQSLKNSLPRKTFGGKNAPEIFDPSNKDYTEGLVVIGLPFFLFGVLGLLIGVIFCMCRTCCDGCGGSTARGRYNPKGRLCLQVSCVLLGLLIAALAIVGIVETFAINKHAVKSLDVASSAARTQRDLGLAIEPAVYALSNATVLGPGPAELTASLKETYDAATSNVSQTRNYERYRHVLYIITMILTVLAALCGFFAPLARSSGCAQLGMVLFVASFALLWITFGVFLSFSLAIEDFCSSLDTALAAGTGAVSEFTARAEANLRTEPAALLYGNLTFPDASGLFFLTCVSSTAVTGAQNSSAYSMEGISRSLVAATAIIAGNIGSAYPNEISYVFNASDPWVPQGADLTGNASRFETYLTQDPWSRAMASDKNAFGQRATIARSVLLASQNITKLGSCADVLSAYMDMFPRICVSATDALDRELGVTFFAAILCIPSTIIIILGVKRFPKQRKRLVPARPLEEEPDEEGRVFNNNPPSALEAAKDAKAAKKGKGKTDKSSGGGGKSAPAPIPTLKPSPFKIPSSGGSAQAPPALLKEGAAPTPPPSAIAAGSGGPTSKVSPAAPVPGETPRNVGAATPAHPQASGAATGAPSTATSAATPPPASAQSSAPTSASAPAPGPRGTGGNAAAGAVVAGAAVAGAAVVVAGASPGGASAAKAAGSDDASAKAAEDKKKEDSETQMLREELERQQKIADRKKAEEIAKAKDVEEAIKEFQAKELKKDQQKSSSTSASAAALPALKQPVASPSPSVNASSTSSSAPPTGASASPAKPVIVMSLPGKPKGAAPSQAAPVLGREPGALHGR